MSGSGSTDMHRASSVELYGGPLDGERRVVPDTQHELTVWTPICPLPGEKPGLYRSQPHKYVRQRDEPWLFSYVLDQAASR
ncbi:hypothetical protein Alex_0044 [Mycobacterium phage Alex]|uniref:Uncharacterized protein n=4 Tax=Pegunavirus TaxID=1623295 RepID=L7TGS6_9CAUD|nr:hypothetical protein Serpentine_0043 [Mycobacterium phage Serpentine]AGC33902.1 hypothetical protein PIGLET_0042 [Mycobacterium phage Piglet]AGC34061.1 hypothetical protein Nacho_0043 [Mycobacterium phage Nacho]AGC34269.1 hypothetical protein Alex_0044 [Mycobacterium phage Alex]AVR55861.1 hypothetical protein SEA_COBRA_43 [Mycobacterium phage Cobra]